MAFRRQGETYREAQIRAVVRRRAKLAKARTRLGRPQEGPPLDQAWPRIASAVRARDLTCRRCSASPERQLGPAAGVARRARFPVDHIIPRRLCPDRATANQLVNLATLCGPCHDHKTHLVEPALYRGDVSHFVRFLAQIEATGPIPDEDARAAAYLTARRHVERAR